MIIFGLTLYCVHEANAQMLTGYSNRVVTLDNSNDHFSLQVSQKNGQQDTQVSYVENLPLGNASSNVIEGAIPVDFQADNLVHDEKTGFVKASGNVMLVQEGRILRADEIVYDLKKDSVVASGNVVLNEDSGDIFYANQVTLKNSMKDGFVTTLHTYLSDGSRFVAETAQRKGATQTVMKKVVFTPCKVCEQGRAPAWQIRASTVRHDKEEKGISYKNARFEFFGVPVAYTPYFSHPDGTVNQKSGFLPPSAGYKSNLGAYVDTRYYWALSRDQDMTFGVKAFTKQAPMLTGQYRSRWENASLEVNGGITSSERMKNNSGVNVKANENVRGHALVAGVWNINNKWRAGTNLSIASDDQYMRQYGFNSKDVMENEIYAERFEGANYASARLIAFQDTRVRNNQEDQPFILPEIIASFRGQPNSIPILGGQWGVDSSYLGLRREGSGQDVDRYSLEGNWNRRLVSSYGVVTNLESSVRGDLYSVNDGHVIGDDKSNRGTRLFSQITGQASYPLVRNFESTQISVEPLLSITASTDLDNDNSIPNEDSQDVQIDASNIFESNRFPGYDRFEDKSQTTYGIRAGLYSHDGSYGNIFLGQSYRFDGDDAIFPVGSGLDQQSSDIVGQLSANYKGNYLFDYRFQLDSEKLHAQRHEVDSYIHQDRLTIGANYLFANALEGTNISENREQLGVDMSYYLAHDWRSRIGAIHDLGERSGLRESYLGVDYLGECISWALTGKRILTNNNSGDSSAEIFFSIGLKNLGEFKESDYKRDETKSCGMLSP